MVVLKRWRHVSGVTFILASRGLCRASEQSLADVAVVVFIVDIASLLLKWSKREMAGRGYTRRHARHDRGWPSHLSGIARSLADIVWYSAMCLNDSYLSDPVVGGKRDSATFNARPPEVGGQRACSGLERVAQDVNFLLHRDRYTWVVKVSLSWMDEAHAAFLKHVAPSSAQSPDGESDRKRFEKDRT